MIRKLQDKDCHNMLEWMGDGEIAKHYIYPFARCKQEDVLAFIENSFDEKAKHFAFVDEYDEYLGTISLKNISIEHGNAEYAIATRKCAQGTGQTYTATMEVLNYAFHELGLNRVYLNVLDDNVVANRFYIKCGFRLEGTFRKHLYQNGQYVDLNWYGILKEDYKYDRK